MTDPMPIDPMQGQGPLAERARGAAVRSGPRCWALIPCAGSGSRAGGEVPKQYQTIAGRALVHHTLAAFAGVERVTHTLVLVAPGDAAFEQRVTMPAPTCTRAACGAATRAGTVANGLVELVALGAHEDDWVLVHDAARCLVTPELIDRLIDACSDDAVGGLLAMPVSDTIKLAAGPRVAATVDRSAYWLAQTPQMFRLGTLQGALAQAGPGVTDESSAIEMLGFSPKLVMGDATNFKVTFAPDLSMAQAVLNARWQPDNGNEDHGQS